MKISNRSIIEKINSSNGWIDANELSVYFDVSTRTIRNYIKNINYKYPSVIISSNKGYIIDKDVYDSIVLSNEEDNNIKIDRVQYIVNQLIVAKEEVDIYDLADELAISDSHIERVLQNTKDFLNSYNINLERKRNKIWLDASEKDVRKLIRNILTTDNDTFIYNSDPFTNSQSIDIKSMKEDISYILESFGYYVTDYGLNTIMLHLIVMIERIKFGKNIDSIQDVNSLTEKEQQMIKEICAYVEEKNNIKISTDDIYSLAIVIINNCANTGDNSINNSNIDSYIENEYVILARDILKNISVNYGIEEFGEEFITTFSVHIANLVKRAKDNSYTPNPLATSFKGNYPLVYDMATYATKAIHDSLNIKINDDEISFIAFHIGSYIENKNINRDKINCCFIYAEYHNFHIKSIEKILKNLDNKLFISSNISIKSLENIPSNVELIISSCPLPKNFTNIPVIKTSMFISTEDISNIHRCISKIKEEKIKKEIVYSLQYFVKKKLFHKNLYLDSRYDVIHYLANECYEQKLVDSTFENEVLERENLSSTSFNNGVAIPHSLNMNANHSFLSVIINDKPMKWDKNEAYIIIMLGTSKVDRDAFKLLFDELISILYDEENVRKLIKSNDYEEFTNVLSSLIMNN